MKAQEKFEYDCIILGAGAAGLMCAIEAGKRGRRVLVIEHNERVGKKIRISGGGRCNFTNLHAKPENYISQNPHFFKSALSRFTPADFCNLVKKHRIPFHEKKLGQLFCDKSAQDIIDMLLAECREQKVAIFLNTKALRVIKKDHFLVVTKDASFTGASLIVATGGLSIPPLGVSSLGYDIAKQFNINVVPPSAALVPLTLNDADKRIFKELSGVSLDVKVTCANQSFRENILFTHRGLSGPAILQISSYWKAGQAIVIDLLPERNFENELKSARPSKTLIKNYLAQFFPKRFAEVFTSQYLKNVPLDQLSSKDIAKAAMLIHQWTIIPAGNEGYAKAEVTLGGVDIDELSSKTMESKKVAGLYFIGEVVDVTGQLGGFNFQWAWASGFCAGQFV